MLSKYLFLVVDMRQYVNFLNEIYLLHIYQKKKLIKNYFTGVFLDTAPSASPLVPNIWKLKSIKMKIKHLIKNKFR